MIELAKTHEEAKTIIHWIFGEPPIAKLFGAILAQARTDGYSNVKVDFIEQFERDLPSPGAIQLRSEIRKKIREAGLRPAERPPTYFLVNYSNDANTWVEVMRIPISLSDDFRGFAILVETAGYSNVAGYLKDGEGHFAPEFTWPSKDVLLISKL